MVSGLGILQTCHLISLFKLSPMADKISPERRSANMRKIRHQDMTPELVVRKTAHRLGYRFRLHRKDLPGKPDLVFPKKLTVIFVHGCFWHHHEAPSCPISRTPKSNTGYWSEKLRRNVERDNTNCRKLRDMGWNVGVIWECEVKRGDTENRIREIFDDIR